MHTNNQGIYATYPMQFQTYYTWKGSFFSMHHPKIHSTFENYESLHFVEGYAILMGRNFQGTFLERRNYFFKFTHFILFRNYLRRFWTSSYLQIFTVVCKIPSGIWKILFNVILHEICEGMELHVSQKKVRIPTNTHRKHEVMII